MSGELLEPRTSKPALGSVHIDYIALKQAHKKLAKCIILIPVTLNFPNAFVFRYCWVSSYLTDEKCNIPQDITPDSMIPMSGEDLSKEKLLIGHNVAFDRSFVKEAYQLKVADFFTSPNCYLYFCQF